MSRASRRYPGLLLGLACTLMSAASLGQTGPAPTARAEPFLQVEIERPCADTDHAALLANELRMRMPDTMVVTGPIDATGRWRVAWRREEDGCVLSFEGGETASTMALPANAEREQIELAASRVAFLASVSEQSDSADPMPLGVPGEEIDEETLRSEEVAANVPSGDEALPPPPPPPPPNDALEPEPTEPTDEPQPTEEPQPTNEPADEAESADVAPDEAQPAPKRYQRQAVVFQPVPGVALPAGDGRPQAPSLVYGLIGSSTAGLQGIALSTIFNAQSDFADGIQMASIFNSAGGAKGIQMAGVFNLADELEGTQVAGVFNLAGGSSDFDIQFAGVANINTGAFNGLQLAGVTNISSGSFDGVEVAGVANIADAVDGAQVGVVNVAGKVDGFQIGIVNIAESSDVSVGLVNIVYSEPFWATAEAATDGILLAGLRHGSRYLKWSLWAGSSAIAGPPLFLIGVGLGFHVPFEAFYIDGDVIGMDATSGAETGTDAGLVEVRLSGGYAALSWLSIYAGGGIRTFFSDGGDLGMVPAFALGASGDRANAPNTSAAWPFAFVGVRF